MRIQVDTTEGMIELAIASDGIHLRLPHNRAHIASLDEANQLVNALQHAFSIREETQEEKR